MRALFRCAALGAVLSAPLAAPALAQDDTLPPGIEREFGRDRLPPPPSRSPEPAAPPPSGADDAAEQDAAASLPAASPADREAALDELFARLKRERAPEAAQAIAGEIQAEWLKSGSATVDLMMLWAATATATSDNGTAFDLLEQAMILAPHYAEAWNARATANFQLSRYGRSLADIEQTLIREPRHFGALMGLGAILEELGRPEAAMDAYQRALAVFPAMREAQGALGRLAQEASGQSL